MSNLPINDLKEEIKKLRRERDQAKMSLSNMTENRDKYKALSETYQHLNELKDTIEKVKNFPEMTTFSIVRVRDVTSNASGFITIKYIIKGGQVVEMKLSPALNLRQSAIDSFKIQIGNELMLPLNERVVDVEWSQETSEYKVIEGKE
jgi:archaellum component FlaC